MDCPRERWIRVRKQDCSNKDVVTKEDMENLRGMLGEMDSLSVELMAPTPKMQVIFYKDYRTGKGIPKTDIGSDGGDEEEARLLEEIRKLRKERAKRILRMERFLERVSDPEMRTILRLYYRDGLSQKEIGERLGYDRSVISRKISTFWMSTAE